MFSCTGSLRSSGNSSKQRQLEQDDEHEERSLSPDMQQFIGRQLRAVYDDVAKQPVPDRFLELMKQLDNKTGAR